jgi:hypothetical protein
MSEPSLQTLALWAAIIIGLLGTFGALITRSLSGRIDDLKEELSKSETRVRDSAKLAFDAVSRALGEAKEAANEKRAEDLERIKRIENVYDINNQMEPRKRP